MTKKQTPRGALPQDVQDQLAELDSTVDWAVNEITTIRAALKDRPTPEDMSALRSRLTGVVDKLKSVKPVPEPPPA